MESTRNYSLNKEIYKNKSLEYYTKSEEIWNVITHFIGGIFGFAGLIYLLVKANTTPRIIAAIVTGIGGSVPYFVSAAYHFIQNPKRKLLARKIDYSGVGFIIVACGAPLALALELTAFNISAISVCFLLCIFIVFLSVYDIKKYSRLVVLLDLIIAAINFSLYMVNRSLLTPSCKICFALGAVFCLLGLAFFGWKKQYLHTCFHILMVLGTVSFLHASIYIFLN